MDVKHLGVDIAAPYETVAAFLAEPENFALWAAGLGKGFRQEDGVWKAEGPEGDITVRFSPATPYGVADHWVTLHTGRVVYIPLRVLEREEGCHVVLSLFRLPEMDDAMFARDAGWVVQDLNRLKEVIEA